MSNDSVNVIETVVASLTNSGPNSRDLIAGLALLAVLSSLSLLHEPADQSSGHVDQPQSAAVQSAISAVSKLLGKAKAPPDSAMLSTVLPMLGQMLAQRSQQPQDQSDQPKQRQEQA
ncbi:MAG: hypothetical protein ACPLPR_02070 [Bacillota bacterium]